MLEKFTRETRHSYVAESPFDEDRDDVISIVIKYLRKDSTSVSWTFASELLIKYWGSQPWRKHNELSMDGVNRRRLTFKSTFSNQVNRDVLLSIFSRIYAVGPFSPLESKHRSEVQHDARHSHLPNTARTTKHGSNEKETSSTLLLVLRRHLRVNTRLCCQDRNIINVSTCW